MDKDSFFVCIRFIKYTSIVCLIVVSAEDKKEYPSLQDMSPSEYMYFPKGVLEEGRPGHFSRRELRDLSAAILVLTIAFSFSISHNKSRGTGIFSNSSMAIVNSVLRS